MSRPAAVRFIFLTLLLDMIGIGVLIPVLPKLVASLQGGNISQASLTFGWFISAYAAMQFLFAPLMGELSDRFGRRPVLLMSLLGAGVDYLLMAFAPSLGWLFLGRVVSGITGANIAAANAYIADVSPPEDRAKNFGMIGACFAIGFVLGPALGGLLASFGPRTPFFLAAGLNFCNLLYGFLVLPESHPQEKRRPIAWKRANPLMSLIAIERYPIVLSLAGTLFLERIAHDSLPGTWVLYTTYRFRWEEWENGLALALVGLMFGVVQATLTGPIVKRLGERGAMLFGIAMSVITFTLYAIAWQGWMMYLFIVIGSVGAAGEAAMMSLISKHSPDNEHGAIQGAIGSVHGIAAIVGPLLATRLFGYFTSPQAPFLLPGAAFFASAVLTGFAFLLAARATGRKTSQG